MSNNITPLKTFQVIDPVVNINKEHTYGISIGGSEVSYTTYTSTTANISSVVFVANPPSQNTLIDRKVYLQLVFNITYVSNNLAAVGTPVLMKNGSDGPRCLPISKVISSMNLKLNNDSVSTQLNSYVGVLERYSMDKDLENLDFSLTPAMPDQSMQYTDQFYGAVAFAQNTTNNLTSSANRNPLATHGTNPAQDTRGGFPFFLTAGTNASVAPPVPPALPPASTVQYSFVEPLLISPLYFGEGDAPGLIGISTVSLILTLGGGIGTVAPYNTFSTLQRIWSHANTTGVPGTDQLVSFNVAVAKATLRFKYITPKSYTEIPKQMTYPYYESLPIITPTNTLAVAAGATPLYTNLQLYTQQMNSYQVNSMPKRMYIYLRQQDSDLNIISSDVYAFISNVNITVGNRSGLLASAAPEDLYQISVRNGCNLSWQDWSTFVGSPLCIDFTRDIGLSSTEAVGLNGVTQLTMNVTYSNLANTAITYTLYTVIVTEGILNIDNGSVTHSIGVVSKQDIVNAELSTEHAVEGGRMRRMYGKSFFGDAWNVVKHYAPMAIEKIAVPLALKKLGGRTVDKSYGENNFLSGGKRRYRKGKGLSGGVMLSRDDL